MEWEGVESDGQWVGRGRVCECGHHGFSHYARPAWHGGPVEGEACCGLCACKQFVARANQEAVITARQSEQ